MTMNAPHTHDTALLFASLGVLLATARLLGEAARRLRLPALAGEMAAGVVLGPTILGAAGGAWGSRLFPAAGEQAAILGGLTKLAVSLFLLVAGMEVDLSILRRRGRAFLGISLAGLALPFAAGAALGRAVPSWFGAPGVPAAVTPLLLGAVLSISALPVIAKILRDLGLDRTEVGTLIVASAVVDDLLGWVVFAVILGLIRGGEVGAAGLAGTLALILGFAALALTAGRWLLDRVLPRLEGRPDGPGAVIGLAVASALLCAGFTDWVGVHANFGAFICGVALGNARHTPRAARERMEDFVTSALAPLFFASLGLRINFVERFDFPLVLTVLAVATVTKVLGCTLGALGGGLSGRDAWAVGFGMNARGAMEIVLATLALEAGAIGEPLFVALVVMALTTSIMAGAVIPRIRGTDPAPRLLSSDSPAPGLAAGILPRTPQ